MAKKKSKEPKIVKDKYYIGNKDKALTYKFVGPRRMQEYGWQGWVPCRKEEHPDLEVSGDLHPDSKEGVYQVGPFTVMCAPIQVAIDRVQESKDITDGRDAQLRREVRPGEQVRTVTRLIEKE